MRRFVSFGPAFVVLITCVVALFVTPALLKQYTFAETRATISLAQQALDGDPILDRLDQAIGAVADATLPSVVHIDVNARPGVRLGSSGAGWVYDIEGHIITNAHVVKGAQNISVEFYDGRSSNDVRVVGIDNYTDIAVLKVNVEGPAFPARLAMEALPRIGQQSFAFGSPFGFKFSMSRGIVSGLGRGEEYGGAFGGYTNYIQTDAAVNPGNSGGPLVNGHAEVIGMNVAIATARSAGGPLDNEDGGDSAGISFAIPLGTIVPIVEQLIQYGTVERGFIGINFGSPNDPNDRAYDPTVRVSVPTDESPSELLTGIRITSVIEDGPSEQAGLRGGDVIVEIAGSPVLGVQTLRAQIASRRPGSVVDITIARERELIDTQITLAPMPVQSLVSNTYQQIFIRLGMIMVDPSSTPTAEDSPIVTEILTNSPADIAGFREGDEILTLDGRPVESVVNFFYIAQSTGLLDARDVAVTVRRPDAEGEPSEVELTLNLYP